MQETITLEVEKALYDALKQIADKQGITVDELASKAVQEAVEKF